MFLTSNGRGTFDSMAFRIPPQVGLFVQSFYRNDISGSSFASGVSQAELTWKALKRKRDMDFEG